MNWQQEGQNPRAFFEDLFGDEVDMNNQISIFSLPHAAAKFFHSVSGAVQFIDSLKMRKRVDVYFGVGLYRPGIVVGRGKAEDVTKITTLWSDVDFGSNHKKNVPPTEGDARKVLDRMPFKPSLIVHSGHGYHCYWKLTEPVEGQEAAVLAKRWNAAVLKAAGLLGYTLDSVGDLSRVLRIPGTMNYKRDPVPVRVIEC